MSGESAADFSNCKTVAKGANGRYAIRFPRERSVRESGHGVGLES
jgi:hypothetical protein